MKTTTLIAPLGLVLSVFAAPRSLTKRLNHPSIPLSDAAIVQQPSASTTPTDALVCIWLDQTSPNTVEIFVTGSFGRPTNVTSADMREWVVAVLELSSQLGVEAAPSSKTDPSVTVWVEESGNATSTAVDVFITSPESDGGHVTTGDLRGFAVGILQLAKKAEDGEAPRQGPYVPRDSILGSVG